MAEEPASPPSRISSQALDVLFKLEAEQIATLLPTRFGLALAPILRPLPTELPRLSLQLQRLDTLFELTDTGILHLLLLMRHGQDTETVARQGLALVKGLPPIDRPRVIGAILSLAYHYQGQALLDRLVEGLMATQVWEQQLVESLERGIEQGIEQGRAEERRALLRHAIVRRFGVIPPSLEARIVAADSETFTGLFDRVLVATTIDDI